MSIDWVAPMMSGLALIAALWLWRAPLNRSHEVRLQQLDIVANLLRKQADAMRHVLSDAAVPDMLKQALISVADKLGDREFMHHVASMLIDRERPRRPDESDEVLTALSGLRITNPDCYDAFIQATVQGVLASLLRWPETARMSEQVIAQLLGDQRRDVDILVAASRSHSPGLPFGIRPGVPAAA